MVVMVASKKLSVVYSCEFLSLLAFKMTKYTLHAVLSLVPWMVWKVF